MSEDPRDVRVDGADLQELADELRANLAIRDRRYGLPPKTYRRCFVGSEAAQYLVESNIASDRADAVRIGNLLMQAGILRHVLDEHPFEDEILFYRFIDHEDHGEVTRKPDGAAVSWADFLPALTQSRREGFQPRVPEQDPDLGAFRQDDLDTIGVAPLDEHNARLLDHTHPKAWKNPRGGEKYNLAVIGAGTAGLVTAAGSAGLGARVALIESHLLGGDCLNIGCVPSKALLRCARVAETVRRSAEFGIRVGDEVEVDFPAVMERMRRLRAGIAPHDSAERFARELGVDVYLGRARFCGPHELEVDGRKLEFAKAVIAAGGSAAVPPIPGIADVAYLTNATVFNLTQLPRRLGVIGAGPIGLELAQAFRRFGSEVTVYVRGGDILPKEDREAAAAVQEALQADGVSFALHTELTRAEQAPGGGAIRLTAAHAGTEERHQVDQLLVAAGRKPLVGGLGLELAGVEYDERMGVKVNDRLQTTNPDIFAAGDVATRYQFTHVADFMARIAIRNALFFGRDNFSKLLIPWATYTDPEVAHVGYYEADLDEQGIAYRTFRRNFCDVDRAVLEGETRGFVKVHVRRGSDQILGATIVGTGAGDLISELTVAMRAGAGLGDIAGTIHPYPTVAEAIRQCGDAYHRARLTPAVKKIFNRLMAIQRR